MRIVIDLQGAQTESRFHGIGRYSLELSLAMARDPRDHEIWLLLNGAFDDSVRDLRRTFADLVPAERIVTFFPPGTVEVQTDGTTPRYTAAERIRRHLLQEIDPDWVLVTGLIQSDAVTSNGSAELDARSAVIVYDLIPWLNPDVYLTQPSVRRYYAQKLEELKAAGLLLTISESSRRETIDELAAGADRVVTISSAASGDFSPGPPAAAEDLALMGVTRPFVLYTPSGYDHRKNIDGLITAFGQLPAGLFREYQLVIASKFSAHHVERLRGVATKAGLESHDVIFTGYVTDDQLVALYRSTALFVYPSFHEGFGLPALEAMACGAPVIGSNCTSIPEVIGRDDALVDPTSPQRLAARIAEELTNPEHLEQLRQHGPARAQEFSWELTAGRALDAMEAAPDRRNAVRRAETHGDDVRPRERLAFVSPLPPLASGIADYSAELLSELAERYDITLVCDQSDIDVAPPLDGLPHRGPEWFMEHGAEFDHVIYQVGNSEFHVFMLPLIRAHPGVVVLHDFFLGGMLWYAQLHLQMDQIWDRAILASHGDVATRVPIDEVLEKTYPANRPIVNSALGVIVHSAGSKNLMDEWYGPVDRLPVHEIPLVRAAPEDADRAKARAELGIDPDAFLVCSFGLVFYPKLDVELLEAWLDSAAAADPHGELHFVGPLIDPQYADKLRAVAAAHCEAADRLTLTDRVSREDYRRYLAAADVAIQLRTTSRGETSAATLDCLNHGIATIVNAHGSADELPPKAVRRISDHFTSAELRAAIDELHRDVATRERIGAAGRELLTSHRPAAVADLYAEALATAQARRPHHRTTLLRDVLTMLPSKNRAPYSRDIARAVARSVSTPLQPRQVLIDISTTPDWPTLDQADAVVQSAPHSVRVSFVRASDMLADSPLVLAPGHPRGRSTGDELARVGWPQPLLADLHAGDILVFPGADALVAPTGRAAQRAAHTAGVRLAVLVESSHELGDVVSLLAPGDLGIFCAEPQILDLAERVAAPHGIATHTLDGPDPRVALVNQAIDVLARSVLADEDAE